MKTKLLGLIAFMVLLDATTTAANASPYVVTLEQVGSNVVATGSGEIDVTGLTFATVSSAEAATIAPSIGFIDTGPSAAIVEGYTGFTGPASFGSGGQTLASSSSGDNVEIFVAEALLYVPLGYVSGNALSDTATYDLATFASLGLTPGIYIWTWGTGADQSFTLDVAATPLPAALPLFATGLGAMGLFGWRRKRKNTGATAAA
jgi:hypothetical protein